MEHERAFDGNRHRIMAADSDTKILNLTRLFAPGPDETHAGLCVGGAIPRIPKAGEARYKSDGDYPNRRRETYASDRPTHA